MNKEELLKRINMLISEAKMDEVNAKRNSEKFFYVGKQNGLLWAKLFIVELKEKE